MPTDREPKEIITSISDDIKTIVKGEVDLAKAEILPGVKKGGIGAGMFGGAGYFALNGLSLLFIAGALGIALLIKHWWALGFVIMGVILLLIAGLLALIGKAQITKAKNAKPDDTVAEAQRTVSDLRGAIQRANQHAKEPLELEPERQATKSLDAH